MRFFKSARTMMELVQTRWFREISENDRSPVYKPACGNWAMLSIAHGGMRPATRHSGLLPRLWGADRHLDSQKERANKNGTQAERDSFRHYFPDSSPAWEPASHLAGSTGTIGVPCCTRGRAIAARSTANRSP